MSPCENNLFIQFDTPEKKDYFLKILEDTNNVHLFQSFVPIFESKKESYGTDSDVYIEYVTFDISDSDVINIIFHTHESPCIEFCKRLAGKYSVNVQLAYFNQESNFSGKIDIFYNQLVKNEMYTYWQGLYILNYDLFWERLGEFFESVPAKTFMEFLQKNNMIIYQNDFSKLNYHFDEYNLMNQFKNL